MTIKFRSTMILYHGSQHTWTSNDNEIRVHSIIMIMINNLVQWNYLFSMTEIVIQM